MKNIFILSILANMLMACEPVIRQADVVKNDMRAPANPLITIAPLHMFRILMNEKAVSKTPETKIIYDFSEDKDISRWHLEGNGELKLTEEGFFQINTFRISGTQKATNVWLADLILPDHFEIEIDFMSRSENGNTMIIFNAQPFELNDLFDDPRIDAVYSDLASKRKMQAYTVGFHRAAYNNPSNLRKIGGKVPEYWGDAPYPTPAWQEMDSITILSSKTEPLTPAEKGKIHHFKLQKNGNHIKFWVNDKLVHDYTDRLQYPYCDQVLMNGRIGFRNFGGPAEDFYSKILIKAYNLPPFEKNITFVR